jgi:uncharacterized Fe-S cluster-containing MiaB family protein
MSERYNLEKTWELKAIMGKSVSPRDMLLELAKLVGQCPHNHTHWIQELTKEGVLTEKLFKRCYLCGYNIDEMEADKEFVEKLLDDFDKACEEKKASIASCNQKGESK